MRPATVADYAAIQNLLHASDVYHAQHAPLLARVPAFPRFARAELAELIANELCLVLVVERDRGVVGFIEASVRWPEQPDDAEEPWCRINNLAVAPAWRRTGIATMLIEATEDWARSKGILQVRLDVFEFNHVAQALYDRLGYQPLTRQMGKSIVPGS